MKKINKESPLFSEKLIRLWEDSYRVNFAIALSRVTGWLLHVDWFKPENAEENEKIMTPLRVYVGDHSNHIFDFVGKKSIGAFATWVITPILDRLAPGKLGGVLTRFYSEEKLFNLPLRVKPSEYQIEEAKKEILKNKSFLKNIPLRPNPPIPAYNAAYFTYGKCQVHAEVMQDLIHLPAVALIARRYSDQFSGSKLGYVHSSNLHPDGSAEDSWGHQTVEEIASRFGIVEYTFNKEDHEMVIDNVKSGSPEKSKELYYEASALITKFYLRHS